MPDKTRPLWQSAASHSGNTSWLLLVAPGLIWGASFLFIAEGMRVTGPNGVTFVRIFVGFATLSMFPAARRPIPRSDWPGTMGLGVLWLAFPLSLFPLAEQHVSSALTGMLNGANPLFTAIVAAVLARRGPSRRVLAGLAIGMAGAVLIAIPAGSDGHSSATGIAMIVAALVSYALALNIASPLQQRNGALPVIWRAQAVALVLTAPLGLHDLLDARWMLGPVLALLALGALGTGVAHAIISVAAGRYGATRASATTYLIPAVALFLGVVVRHEKVPLLSVAGSAVCIGGAWMLRRAQSPNQMHNMSTLQTTPQFLRDGKFLPLSRGGISRRRMTNANTKWIIVVATVCGGLATTHLASSQDSGPVSRKKDRARVVSSQPLPKLDGDHLKGILVEVRYGPGEASSPHAHPCAVMGYIVEGSLRTQIEGEPERIYQAGESFYEAPNGVHRVSANASSTEKAVLVGYLICDHDTPLSVDVPASISAKGRSK